MPVAKRKKILVVDDPDDPRLDLADVVGLVDGVDRKSVQNWTDRGLVTLASPNPGRRRPRKFSLVNVLQVATLHQMAQVGLSRIAAARFSEIVVDRLRRGALEHVRHGEDVRDWSDKKQHALFCFEITADAEIRGEFLLPSEVASKIRRDEFFDYDAAIDKRLFPVDRMIWRIILKFQEMVTGSPTPFAK